MNLDINNLIDIFSKLNTISNKEKKLEFDEQESASGGGTAPSGGSGKSVPKWADVVGGPKRGPANKLGKSGEVWDSAKVRGVANQIY